MRSTKWLVQGRTGGSEKRSTEGVERTHWYRRRPADIFHGWNHTVLGLTKKGERPTAH